jgi:hypothetical protein
LGPGIHSVPELRNKVLRDPVAAILAAAVTACVVVALLTGRHAAGAAAGALLVPLYWLGERAAARLGAREATFARALLVGLGGMVARLAVVLGVLVAIGVLWRDQFAAAAVAFLATYTVYMFLRLWRNPAVVEKG